MSECCSIGAIGEASCDVAPPWVLHIEDDADLSAALKIRLEAHGVAVVRAFDGMEGYRNAFTHAPDVIILDIQMSNGSGDYVLRRLKENPVTENMPVIVLTGKGDQALRRKMLNLGADRFLTKPLDFAELLDELKKHVDVLAKPTLDTR